jgi:hypothetical protein
MLEGQEIRDGRIYETIYGVECCTPPIPPLDTIEGYGLPRHKQKWKPPPIPSIFKDIKRDEYGVPIYSPEQWLFIEEQYRRRDQGHWFYNDGDPTYITGGYYFELSWWKIDIGLKAYRDRDRRKWMFWEKAERDPNCLGVAYMKHRRDGATYWAGCLNYLTISRQHEAHGGIQSKTGKDAAKVFQKAVVKPFRKLPAFFQPIFDGSDNMQTAMHFREPSSRMTKKNRVVRQSAALNSFIDWQATIAEAYDGDKLQFAHLDEQGKNVECKFSELWEIIKECLTLGGGKKVIGKALITTTVAEGTKKGGDEFHKVWKNSDPTNLVEGQTVSGLWRLFIPANDGLENFIDDHGRSMKEEALAFLLAKREGYKRAGDIEGLAEFRRKFPLNESDAFTPPPTECLFDSEKLSDRQDELQYKKNLVTQGNFVWENNIKDGKVVFYPDQNGKWLVSYLFRDPKEANQVERRGNLYFPKNKNKFCGAADPVDHKNLERSEKKSRFAGTAFRKYDMMEPEDATHKFVARYLYRPPTPEIAYEDMILMCCYYGMDIFPEMDKPGIERYFESRGYGPFIGTRPRHTYTSGKEPRKAEKGVFGRSNIHIQIVEAWQSYVYEHCHKIDFPEMIEDLLGFDINATTKFDLAMCGGYNLIYANKVMPKQDHKTSGYSYVKRYRNGQRIKEPV